MQTIAIVGASVRAAVFSALRAGFAPIGMDRFADWDLRLRAVAARVDRYPEGFEAALAGHRFGAWMYTGGLENHPDLVDRLASKVPLWGTPGSALREVRDPFQWGRAFVAAEIPCPVPRSRPEGLPDDGSWLIKPLRGSGGAGIRPWRGGDTLPRHDSSREWYFQPRIAGTSCSAVFLGANGQAHYLGATRQLVGEGWNGAPEFAYGGSIGPWELSRQTEAQWRRIGDCLVRRFSLLGLFGVDGIFDGETVWPIEVNPRYPASVEVLERAMGFRAIQLHAAVFCGKTLPEVAKPVSGRCVGKAILYAPADLVVPKPFGDWARRQAEPWPFPDLADIPDVGVPFRKGEPVATVFAEAAHESAVRDALIARLEEAKRFLGAA